DPELDAAHSAQRDAHTPDYEHVFSDERVHDIHIQITPDVRRHMLDNMTALFGPRGQEHEHERRLPERGAVIDEYAPTPDYFPVTVHEDGRSWRQVAMRYKGNSTLSTSWEHDTLKISFRLHFDRFEDQHPEITGQRFHGFQELVFASGFMDRALLRDKLAADLLRAQGAPAAQAAYYRVFVDAGEGPEYWGLYLLLEEPSDTLISSQFAAGTGTLYKPDGPGADFTHFDPTGFPKKTRKQSGDFSDVERAITALHAPREQPERWRSQLEAAFDVGGFLKMLATSRALLHWDCYGFLAHNYFVYGDPSHDGRLSWISWDHNNVLLLHEELPKLSVMMDEVDTSWPLIRYLLDDPQYRAAYRAELASLLTGPFAKQRFDRRVTQLHQLIAPHVIGPDGEHAPYTHLSDPQQLEAAVADLIAAADARRAELVQVLLPSP
ncbi:MAG: CotH kinase family protein, partial [Polyangiales bacterium]